MSRKTRFFLLMALVLVLTMGIITSGPPAEDTTAQAQIIDLSPKMTPTSSALPSRWTVR